LDHSDKSNVLTKCFNDLYFSKGISQSALPYRRSVPTVSNFLQDFSGTLAVNKS